TGLHRRNPHDPRTRRPIHLTSRIRQAKPSRQPASSHHRLRPTRAERRVGFASPPPLDAHAMAALVETSMGVVREVLGDSVVDEVDEPIVSYIANVLADQDFDFGPPDGHGIFD
uniref:Uncharacterized protein n=1 Tax=Aegilops tauschii subsp. strangulata TaxID=200361 RepID=A0A453Q5F8_AEGTS